jgi:hypothetical protein
MSWETDRGALLVQATSHQVNQSQFSWLQQPEIARYKRYDTFKDL